LDVAERARPRAGIPHDHEGCVSLFPAFADVGTAGLLAHGVQAIVAHDFLGREIARRYRRLNANPRRLGQNRGIRLVCLFGVPWTRVFHKVKDNRHGTYLRLLPHPRKAGQAPRIARQMSRNMTAPTVAVIRLPQKSGTTSSFSFSNRNPPTIAPTRPTARLHISHRCQKVPAAVGLINLTLRGVTVGVTL